MKSVLNSFQVFGLNYPRAGYSCPAVFPSFGLPMDFSVSKEGLG